MPNNLQNLVTDLDNNSRLYIDLHVHSTASDGTVEPAQLVNLANQNGLYAFALTDHDCVNGIAEAMDEASRLEKIASSNGLTSIKVIPGIEISTEYLGEDTHILGLGIDYTNQKLVASCEHLQNVRTERNQKIISKMNTLGFTIDEKTFFRKYEGTSITRMHYAKFMAEAGYVESYNEAFEKYLGNGCPLNIPREKIKPEDAINIIHNAGGKAVLAHPVLYKWAKEYLTESLDIFVSQGLDGIEAVYSRNKNGDEAKYKTLASRLHLFITGGSDFHGTNKPDIDLGVGTGNLAIPKELLKNIF